MQHVATPKKAVEKIVRPTQAATNDKCRFCPFQFSVKYGNFGNLVKPSSEKRLQNLIEQRVQRHEDFGRTLQRIGIFSSEVFQIFGKDLQGLWKKSEKNSQLLQPNLKCFGERRQQEERRRGGASSRRSASEGIAV